MSKAANPTFKSIFDGTDNWWARVILVRNFHFNRNFDNKDWGLRQTANYFDVSTGWISETLKLSRNRELVIDCKTRKEALIKIKGIK